MRCIGGGLSGRARICCKVNGSTSHSFCTKKKDSVVPIWRREGESAEIQQISMLSESTRILNSSTVNTCSLSSTGAVHTPVIRNHTKKSTTNRVLGFRSWFSARDASTRSPLQEFMWFDASWATLHRSLWVSMNSYSDWDTDMGSFESRWNFCKGYWVEDWFVVWDWKDGNEEAAILFFFSC